MSDVAKILTSIGNSHKSGYIDQQQHDRLLTLTSNKNDRALTLASRIDSTPEQFAQYAVQILKELEGSGENNDEKKLRASGPSARKALGLNITAVKQANQTPEALEADEEQTENDLVLKAKSLNGRKERKTMPEKLQLDPSKLNKEAAPAKN
jgi:hypothetical protein